MPDNREADIINRVQQGFTADFEQLVVRYERPLFRMVGNLLGRSHRVEDVVQEAFLAAFRHIRTYDSERGRFSTWLYRIARNTAFNELKRGAAQAVARLPEADDQRLPDEDLILREEFRRLDRTLAGLSFRDRSVFVMAELEGLSYAEIADVEGIAVGTVKSRLSRTRTRLRNLLAPKRKTHHG